MGDSMPNVNLTKPNAFVKKVTHARRTPRDGGRCEIGSWRLRQSGAAVVAFKPRNGPMTLGKALFSRLGIDSG
jgi:hypothetical protein